MTWIALPEPRASTQGLANTDLILLARITLSRSDLQEDLPMTAFPATGPAVADVAPDLAEVERIGEEIARLASHLNAATFRLLTLIRVFDEREGWGSGFRSCAHWLSWRIGLAPGAAREHVRVARALAALPVISEAMRRGAISYSKARALTRVARPDTEQRLLDCALHGTAAHVEKLVRAWRRVDRAEEAGVPTAEGGGSDTLRHERRHLELYPDEDGSWVLRGRLTPEVGAVLQAALDAGASGLYRDAKEADVVQRRADAMGLLAERALAALDATAGADGDVPAGTQEAEAARPIGRADRYQVVVHVDAEALVGGSEAGQAVLHRSGFSVPPEAARRIACDAGLVAMRHDADGTVLDVGRKRRTVPPALRRALEYRDGGCRFPGCGSRYCDAHHIRHWADGGETSLSNTLLACRVHHRALHEGGFGVERSEGGELRFYRPNGTPLPDAPGLPPAPADAVGVLEAEHERQGLDVPAETTPPTWLGERLDVDWAILTMWERSGGRASECA
jgi:hypothetical protein